MRGPAIGVAIAALVIACSGAQKTAEPPPDWVVRMEKMQIVNGLWLQIRDMRREAGMELDPPAPLELQYRARSRKPRAICPEAQPTAPTCDDTCTLANAICDNAETICKIADELGKDDPSQDKCTSAKASCHEAKQRCCDCNANPPVVDTTGQGQGGAAAP